VLIDDFQAGFDATEHLIKNGCNCIAHFSGPLDMEIYNNRFEGYKAALKKYKLPFKKELILSSRLMQQDGIDNAKSLLALPYRVDGVFSANDVAAISAIQYFKKQNIKIPKDIAIVGFSNEVISSVIEPSLSTINQSGIEIGKTAPHLLLSQINNSSNKIVNKTIILPTNLIERKSSKKQ
jgi:LacI family transcriptional regulator